MTGSRTADMRSALVDYFREQGCIMIATEAGAEGINLQFSSLVVNYDLPWNPQRIEQRIGRCHRYGQQHDVVVVNFFNCKNAADQRVFQLLAEKFSLFEGVFGASDEASKAYLNRFERLLMHLTRHELNGHAEFLDDSTFRLSAHPFPDRTDHIPLGLYELPRRSGEAHLYRRNHHPLVEALLTLAKHRVLAPAEIRFDYGRHDGKVFALETLLGQSGWLTVSSFTIESLDQAEDHLIIAAINDQGQSLDMDTATRLLTLPGEVLGPVSAPGRHEALEDITRQREIIIQKEISERNARFFEAEAEKLDGWADDLKTGLEREIKELDRQIKEARRVAVAALSLEEKLAGQKQIKALEAQRNQKRRFLFDAQDDVDRQREEFIVRIEGKLRQKKTAAPLFLIRWTMA